MRASSPASAVGSGLTITRTESTAAQRPSLVDVNVYVVVTVGVATGSAQVVHDRPMAGDHENSVPPRPASCALSPIQIAISLPASTTGYGSTTTVTASLDVQPSGLVATTV